VIDLARRIEPPDWWWPSFAPRPRFSLMEASRRAGLDPHVAENLWALVARGESLTIASGTSGAGKTSLQIALLPAIPVERRVYFVRGSHDDLSAIRGERPEAITLVVNEFGPTLPIYCWDRSLRLVLDLAEAGAQVLATMHGESADEIAESLSIARLSRDRVKQLGALVFLGRRDLARLDSAA
jgi:hypothetical protein